MASEAKTSANTVEIFSYIARDGKSGVVKGEIKALEERNVQDQLKKMGLDPISITIKKASILEKLDVNMFDSVPPDAIYNFSRQLSVMLKAGVPLVQAFDIVAEGSDNDKMRELIMSVRTDVSSGSGLAGALGKHSLHFDELFCCFLWITT